MTELPHHDATASRPLVAMKPVMTMLKSFLWLIANALMANAYLTSDNNSGSIQRTGIKREIQWKQFSHPVPLSAELELLRKNVLYRRGEFGPLNSSRQLELELECYAVGMTCQQGHCMRKQQLIRNTIVNGDKLKDERLIKRLSRQFEKGHKSLLKMSKELDLPPVSIFRAILDARLAREFNVPPHKTRSRIIKSMMYEHDSKSICTYLLSDFEFQQMQLAKQNDIVAYAHDDALPQQWEDQVMAHLDEHNINYVNEEILRQSDSKSTPDFLILDDLYINNKLTRWIEVKSFYASGLRENHYFTKKALLNQVKRYERELGSGVVILKNGFSDAIINKFDRTLLLDGGPLSDFTTLIP